MLFLLADDLAMGWDLSISKILAAEAALANNFTWNQFWTFRERAAGGEAGSGRFSRFLTFNLICVAGIGLSVLLLNIQVIHFGINKYAANFAAVVLVSFWNFWLSRRLVWRRTCRAQSSRQHVSR